MKKGIYKCKKCDGTGRIELTYEQAYGISSGGPNLKNIVCTICKGDGYLDWVENIVGKKMTNREKFMAQFRKEFKKNPPYLAFPKRIS